MDREMYSWLSPSERKIVDQGGKLSKKTIDEFKAQMTPDCEDPDKNKKHRRRQRNEKYGNSSRAWKLDKSRECCMVSKTRLCRPANEEYVAVKLKCCNHYLHAKEFEKVDKGNYCDYCGEYHHHERSRCPHCRVRIDDSSVEYITMKPIVNSKEKVAKKKKTRNKKEKKKEPKFDNSWAALIARAKANAGKK